MEVLFSNVLVLGHCFLKQISPVTAGGWKWPRMPAADGLHLTCAGLNFASHSQAPAMHSGHSPAVKNRALDLGLAHGLCEDGGGRLVFSSLPSMASPQLTYVEKHSCAHLLSEDLFLLT